MTSLQASEADPPDHVRGLGAADAPRPCTAASRVPGSDWRVVLAETMERAGTRSTFADLLHAISGCDAGLTDVAGWLVDELSMGRVQRSAPDALALGPSRYELAPGAGSHRTRLQR